VGKDTLGREASRLWFGRVFVVFWSCDAAAQSQVLELTVGHIGVCGRKYGGPITLGEQLLVAIVALLLIAYGMLWYSAYLLQENIETQRHLGPDVVDNPSANRLAYTGGEAESELNALYTLCPLSWRIAIEGSGTARLAIIHRHQATHRPTTQSTPPASKNHHITSPSHLSLR